MAVEPATLSDLDRIVELWVALATEQRSHDSRLTVEPNRELMRETLAQHVVDHTCFVSRSNAGGGRDPQRVSGFVSFGLERDGLDRDVDRGVVQNLYVEPPARDQGIGSALLEAAEQALRAAGADRVTLEALAANRAARRFYERRGYEPHRVAYERPLGSDTDSREGD